MPEDRDEKLYERKDGLRNHERFIAALCYAPFGFILGFILSDDRDIFVRFHAKQGICIFVPYIVLAILVPGGFLVWLGLALIYIPMALWFGFQAFSGERPPLPFIGKYL